MELSKSLQSVVDQCIREEFGLKNFETILSAGCVKGDNYIGVIYRVSIKMHPTLGLIVKIPPQHVIRREQFSARQCFLREIKVYTDLLPLFDTFLPENHQFNNVPRLFKSVTEDFNEALLIEDLKLAGYAMFDRRQELTLPFALKAVETLAKFHALSFVAKEKYPKKFDDILLLRKDDKGMQDFLQTMSNRALQVLDPEKDKKVFEKISTFLATPFMENYSRLVASQPAAEPYAINTHGDFWINNILFKTNEEVFLIFKIY